MPDATIPSAFTEEQERRIQQVAKYYSEGRIEEEIRKHLKVINIVAGILGISTVVAFLAAIYFLPDIAVQRLFSQIANLDSQVSKIVTDAGNATNVAKNAKSAAQQAEQVAKDATKAGIDAQSEVNAARAVAKKITDTNVKEVERDLDAIKHALEAHKRTTLIAQTVQLSQDLNSWNSFVTSTSWEEKVSAKGGWRRVGNVVEMVVRVTSTESSSTLASRLPRTPLWVKLPPEVQELVPIVDALPFITDGPAEEEEVGPFSYIDRSDISWVGRCTLVKNPSYIPKDTSTPGAIHTMDGWSLAAYFFRTPAPKTGFDSYSYFRRVVPSNFDSEPVTSFSGNDCCFDFHAKFRIKIVPNVNPEAKANP